MLQVESYRRSLDVHEFEGTFQGSHVLFRMTSVIGHVFSIDFLPQFQSWERTDPQDLFFAGTRKSEANPKVSLHWQSCSAAIFWDGLMLSPVLQISMPCVKPVEMHGRLHVHAETVCSHWTAAVGSMSAAMQTLPRLPRG